METGVLKAFKAFLLIVVIGVTGFSVAGKVDKVQFDKVSISKPVVADSAWRYVLNCTKILDLDLTGLSPDSIKWYKAKMPHTQEGILLAERVYPDTIILDDRIINEFDIVAHELLHYLLHENDAENPSHPFVPFFAPCKLTRGQTGSFDLSGVLHLRSGRTLYPRVDK